MTERWQRELAKLDDLDTPDGVWERAQQPPAGEPPINPRTRVAAAVVAFIVFAGAGTLVWRAFGSPDRSPSSAASPGTSTPDVVRIVCRPNRVSTVTPVVRAQPDGVHIAVDDRRDATQVSIRLSRVSEPGESIGGRVRGRELILTLAPGTYRAACVRGYERIPTSRQARFRVVDPEGLWWSPTPECRGAIERRIDIGGPATFDSLDEIVRSGLPGLRPTDQVRAPGYPARQSWMAPLVAVRRSGRVIATVASYQEREDIKVCPGAGIAEPAQP